MGMHSRSQRMLSKSSSRCTHYIISRYLSLSIAVEACVRYIGTEGNIECVHLTWTVGVTWSMSEPVFIRYLYALTDLSNQRGLGDPGPEVHYGITHETSTRRAPSLLLIVKPAPWFYHLSFVGRLPIPYIAGWLAIVLIHVITRTCIRLPTPTPTPPPPPPPMLTLNLPTPSTAH